MVGSLINQVKEATGKENDEEDKLGDGKVEAGAAADIPSPISN